MVFRARVFHDLVRDAERQAASSRSANSEELAGVATELISVRICPFVHLHAVLEGSWMLVRGSEAVVDAYDYGAAVLAYHVAQKTLRIQVARNEAAAVRLQGSVNHVSALQVGSHSSI